jgi:hypothetical protein
LREELSEKSAVAVAEDEGPLVVEHSGEVVKAAAFEGASESQVFEPVIGAGYEVEVGCEGSGSIHEWATQRSSGLVASEPYPWPIFR